MRQTFFVAPSAQPEITLCCVFNTIALRGDLSLCKQKFTLLLAQNLLCYWRKIYFAIGFFSKLNTHEKSAPEGAFYQARTAYFNQPVMAEVTDDVGLVVLVAT